MLLYSEALFDKPVDIVLFLYAAKQPMYSVRAAEINAKHGTEFRFQRADEANLPTLDDLAKITENGAKSCMVAFDDLMNLTAKSEQVAHLCTHCRHING